MNRLTATLLFAFTAANAQELEIEYYDGRPAVAGELLVKFRDGADGSRKLRGDVIRMRRFLVREALDLGSSGYTHLKLNARQGRRTMLELAQDPDVEYVEPNYIIQQEQATSRPNDPGFDSQWGLRNPNVAGADIDALAAWAITKGSTTNVIGVIDTGIDYNHPDLRANVWSAPREFTVTFSTNDRITCPAGSRGYNAFTNTCDPMDVSSHGTAVAGVIAAAGNNSTGMTGVNWTGSIMGLAFMNAKGQGSVAHAIRAIEFAVQAKQTLGSGANLRVLNASWGGNGYSRALFDQIAKAGSENMLFVAAAGNTPTNRDITPDFPSSFVLKNLVAVAATDERDGLASFSAFGPTSVHLGAPGNDILTTTPANGYARVSGTSFAAPMTSGVAGLVLAACGPLSAVDLRKAILDNASPIPSLSGKTVTGARLNAFRAIRSCAPSTAPSIRLTETPASVTLIPGGSVSVPVQVTATGDVRTTVSLSITGLPAGVTGQFQPAVTAPNSRATLSLRATPQAAITASPVTATIRGVSGSLTTTLPLNIQISPPFTISVVPGSATLHPGTSVDLPVQVIGAGGFAGQVTLSASGLPAGVTGVFSSASTTPNNRVTFRLTAASTAALTTTDVRASIRGTNASITNNTEITVGVRPAPNFELRATPTSLSVNKGETVTFNLVMSRTQGFNQAVSVSLTGIPANTTVTRTVANQDSQTIQIATTANTPARNYNITVIGSAGTLRKVTTVSLTVR